MNESMYTLILSHNANITSGEVNQIVVPVMSLKTLPDATLSPLSAPKALVSFVLHSIRTRFDNPFPAMGL